MQQLRGREGMRIKRLYKQQSARTGVPWSGRAYVPGQPNERGDDVNRVLSLSHGCLYAICHAVITGLGLSPGLGFVHTGNALSFVMDIADLYKGQYTIPIAFDLTAQHLTTERDVRTACRDQIATGHFMAQIVKDIIALLTAGTTVDLQPDDVNVLWDEHSGPVPGGTNWAELLAAEISADTIFGITGPELHPSPAL
jgi:CRISPR-associated protein Cas1